MTFYSEQIQKIKKEFYPKDYLAKQVIGAKQYIDRQFADNINLTDLAACAFMSKFHFIRLFKLLYGETPHQYLVTVRIENAKRLLNSDRSISEVCTAVGFNSPTSFTGLFKKITGVTPTTFKKKINRKAIFKRHNYKSMMTFAQ
ncbi:MAG: AraC family transcriptional regulator [Ferruginibacter sp.]